MGAVEAQTVNKEADRASEEKSIYPPTEARQERSYLSATAPINIYLKTVAHGVWVQVHEDPLHGKKTFDCCLLHTTEQACLQGRSFGIL